MPRVCTLSHYNMATPGINLGIIATGLREMTTIQCRCSGYYLSKKVLAGTYLEYGTKLFQPVELKKRIRKDHVPSQFIHQAFEVQTRKRKIQTNVEEDRRNRENTIEIGSKA